jgi:glycosyltransferase involved in cell wall biosynthesis
MAAPAAPPVAFDVVLPCLDEAAALPWVLSHLPAQAHAIVVDNGSTDGSAAIARSLGAEVVDCPQRGYGAACQAGLEAATADIVAFCDCDASIDPGVISAFVDQITGDRADLVVARRRPATSASWPLHARVANYVLAGLVRRRISAPLKDLGPLRVARRQPLLDLNIVDRRSGYPLETVLRAAAAGWTITGIDTVYAPRVGRSKVTGTARGTVQAVRDMRAVFAQCCTP